MATSKNAKLEFESSQTPHSFAAMTDSGDGKVHTISGGTILSMKSGREPVIRPNGIVTGRNLVTPHADADKVSVAAFTAYCKGYLKTVAAGTVAVTRAATDVSRIVSITMDDTGALAAVNGTDGSGPTFTETRGEAGGPPEIPADSVELAQVRMAGNTSAVIDADEIFQTVGTHAERFDFPTWSVHPFGEGDRATVSAKKYAHVEMASELPAIHASGALKKVYIRFYSPAFVATARTKDFVPVERSHSSSSEEVYGDTVGSVSSSIGQGAFTALMNDNITDALLQEQDENITFRFFPDRNKTPYIITQGVLGIARTFPVGSQNQASATISPERVSAGFAV